MRGSCGYEGRVRERPPHPREDEVARRWWKLAPGTSLPLSNGGHCQLVYPGRPGGSLGPDARDAVLRCVPARGRAAQMDRGEHGEEQTGDVEFHVRASDWLAHRHHTDARYNNVILHVVLICDSGTCTIRQDGAQIPTCSLSDLPASSDSAGVWPCHRVIGQMDAEERARLLKLAGLLRFEQKAHAFVELLRECLPYAAFSAYDVCLIPALAEGLGYGRDRVFFRAAGQRLLGLSTSMPEPLGRTPEPPDLDACRLHILRDLVRQWYVGGAWQAFHVVLCSLGNESSARRVLDELRAMFGRLSVARADILICNVVLPFAAAIALVENDTLLAEQAKRVYGAHPGLSSNQVTRAMCRQLQLQDEPAGACQQQGLHYIYQETCREKRCEECIAGKKDI